MSRFEQIDSNKWINTDTIKKIEVDGYGRAFITLNDGSVSMTNDNCINYLLGSETIVQVIPVAIPTMAVYEDSDTGKEFKEEIHYLGLTAEGCIRPLCVSDGFYDIADRSDSFVGIEEVET